MNESPDEKSAGDIAYAIARAALGSVPLVGSAAQVIFEEVLAPPLEKRRQAWMEQFAGIVSELQEKVADLTPEKLSENQIFVSAAIRASQIALRSQQAEKIGALRNAILNSALPGAPDEDTQQTFLGLVDSLTASHLRLLGVLNDPPGWMARTGTTRDFGLGGPIQVVQHCLPELRGRDELCVQLVRALQAGGLVADGNFMNVTMTGHGMVASRTTALGKAFIAFITARP